jgi:ankyrin repeat protein
MHHPQVIRNENIAIKLIEKGVDATIQNRCLESYFYNHIILKGADGLSILGIALNNGLNINAKIKGRSNALIEIISELVKIKVVSENSKREKESLFRMAQELISSKIDLNAVDTQKETVLFKAIREEDFQVISFLLSAGVNPNIYNRDYQTVLHYVIYQGAKSINILILLLDYGANPSIIDNRKRTIYEILNNIILYTNNKKDFEDEYILKLIVKNGEYMVILEKILERIYKNSSLNFLDTTGNPLFFTPILYEDISLFKLYIKHGLNIQTLNKEKHNLLYEYILNAFKNNNVNIEFQRNISMLLSAKLNHNCIDEEGYTIIHRILDTECNEELFNTLTKIILFDYNLTDRLGRSVIHTAVWKNKKHIIKRIAHIKYDILNIADDYGILPITYAGLMGSSSLVLLLISLKSNLTSGMKISEGARKKFLPMLINLEKLRFNLKDKDTLNKIDMVIRQIKQDFDVINIENKDM